MLNRYKYPRTPHLPFSEGVNDDDKKLSSDKHFYDMKKVVVTTKMDGENTTIYSDGFCHARSIDSKHREYHSWLLSKVPEFSYLINEGQRVCGEYLYAKHSIGYDDLDSYFEVFSIWDGEMCLSWNQTVTLTSYLGLETVPLLYVGKYDESIIKSIYEEEVVMDGQEGIVVRNYEAFDMKDFDKNIAKMVRPNHVQTDKHWSLGEIEVNGLLENRLM